MSNEQFLKSSPRQIKTLIKFHKNYSKGILLSAIGEFWEALNTEKEEYEYGEIESLADI